MENTIYNTVNQNNSVDKFNLLNYSEIKEKFPDEWILLANPLYNNMEIINGIILYHSKDKREVCYKGRDKTSGFDKIIIIYTGNILAHRKIGIMKKTP
jgi:hypothetical protein